ncbi:hypothetical protein [Mumia sp. DW29H23]|uniref:hypothetical protein n=1 Tax=Mumia sp. DW29H23 TaxID=3421241 RepID=UPI003D689A52
MGHTTPAPTPRITVAALLLAVEGLALVVFAVLDLLDLHRDRAVLAIGTSIFFFAYAALLLVSARGLWRLQSWVRAPIAFTQLIQLGLAWNLREAAPPLAGVFVVVAAAVLWGTLSPATSRILKAVDDEARASQL